MNPLASWTEEQRSAFLCRVCATAEQGTRRAELFRRLAGEAEAQAAIWRAQLTARGHPAPGPYRPDARTRIVARLVQTVGPRPLRRVLAAMKVRGMAAYAVARDESRARPSATLEERPDRRLFADADLRCALLGMNEGLIGNGALILAVAGAGAEPGTIVLAGVAGMAAGALAKAAGAYVDVTSQHEVAAHALDSKHDDVAQSALASPVDEALRALLAFAAGAMLPLAPIVALPGERALVITAGVAAMALFAIGAVLARLVERSPWLAGARLLALGSAAGALAFAIGRALGALAG